MLDILFQLGFFFYLLPVVDVGPGYFDPIPGMSISALGTNNLELEKSGSKRVRRDTRGLHDCEYTRQGEHWDRSFRHFLMAGLK